VSSGSLPTGLSLNSTTGAITGTPTGSGSSSFTVQALDSNGNTGTRPYTVNIGTNSLTVNPASLPAGTQGVVYNQAVTASGGTAPYTFSVSSGSLPAGLSLNASTGAIIGTPTGSGASIFTIQVSDSGGNTGSRSYTINIGTNSLSVNPASLPAGTQGVAYNQTVTATGGTAPYTFLVSSGSLPAGLSLNASTGTITGTPTGSGASSFIIQARDSHGNTGSRPYTVNIGTSSLAVNPASLPAGTQGVAYNQTVTATGGAAPYTFSVSSGSLPAGLSLNSGTGAITGTPTGSGASSFTVQARDGNGNTGSRSYTVNVGTNSLTVGPSSLPPSTLGVPYNQTVTASGGTAPYTYTITSGSLPPGLSLDGSTGAIRGTTTTNGTFTFAIQARDSFGNVGARTFMLTTRSNPALDPEVQGLVAAQAAAARRFADGQVTNVMRRLEQLHQEADPCGIDISIGVSTPYQDRNVIPPGALAPVQEVEAIPRTAAALLACEKDRIRQPSISMWSSGAMELGTSNLNGLPDRQRFSTSGITVGADGRFADQLALGLAVGFGFDRTKIGVAGTANDANTVASLIYASYRPYGGWFIDGTLGSGALNFSTRRWVTDDSSVVEGRRSGSYWLASMALGLEQKLGMFRIVPYLRGDYFGINLKGYAETGSSNLALTYADTKFDTRTMSLGLRGSYDIAADWGMIAPNVRVEYKRAFDSRFAQSMFYNDIGSIATYDFVQAAAARNTLSGTLGIRVRTRSAVTFDAEYGVSIGSNSLQSQILRGTLRVPY